VNRRRRPIGGASSRPVADHLAVVITGAACKIYSEIKRPQKSHAISILSRSLPRQC
jgi:hypothetical protein